MNEHDGDHEIRSPSVHAAQKPAQRQLMIQYLQARPCGTGRWYVNERQQNTGDDLQQQQHKTCTAEDVPPARSLARDRMLCGLLDEALELHTALYPIVGLLVPGHGRIPLTSLASFASV